MAAAAAVVIVIVVGVFVVALVFMFPAVVVVNARYDRASHISSKGCFGGFNQFKTKINKFKMKHTQPHAYIHAHKFRTDCRMNKPRTESEKIDR